MTETMNDQTATSTVDVPTTPSAPAALPAVVLSPTAPTEAPTPARELTVDDILDVAHRIRRERVYLRTLNGYTYAQEISAAQMDAIQSKAVKVDGDGATEFSLGGWQMSWVMCGWVDKNGERLFKGAAGLEKLGSMRADVVREMYGHVQRLSGESAATDATNTTDLGAKATAGNSDAGTPAGI